MPVQADAPIVTPVGTHPSAEYSSRRRWFMLFILYLVSTFSYLDRTMIRVALEPIKAEFHVSDTMLGLLGGSAFAFFYATLGIPVARWADRGDRRVVVTTALAVWSGMTALGGVATTFWQLAVARLGVGAGESGAMAPAQSLLTDYFPPEQRTRAISIFLLSMATGSYLGLAAGGWVTQTFGWRAMFLAAGWLGLLLAPVVYLSLKEPRRGPHVTGSTESMLMAVKALRSKPCYVLAVVAMTFYFFVANGPLTFIVPFFVRAHGLTLVQIGQTYALSTAVGSVTGVLVGGAVTERLVRFNVRWFGWVPAICLPVVCALYLVGFTVHTTTTALVLLFCATVVTTATNPPMYALLHAVCGSKRRVMAVSIAMLSANLVGIGLGPVATGMASDYFAVAFGAVDGLRCALVLTSLALIPASGFFVWSAHCIRADLEH